jgi:hypothetical protein
MNFTHENFIDAVQEMYDEWKYMSFVLEGENSVLPDFEEALEHVKQFGTTPAQKKCYIGYEETGGIYPDCIFDIDTGYCCYATPLGITNKLNCPLWK